MVATGQLKEVVVKTQPMTPEAFAPYGRLVRVEREPLLITDGRFMAHIVTVHRAPEALTSINRHMDHSQMFVPLNGAPTVVIVAPPDVPMDGFDPSRIVAFITDGTYGFTFDPATWHTEPRAFNADTCQLMNVQTDVYRQHTELLHLERDCGTRVLLEVGV